ncbi:flagellin FliC [Bacteriovorax stolpii]|uniref:Flagellin n=1 Tax=Bacteriovorax stolpii TaxID=960 RepID=A0A2K9NM65_BACTC|nr:flagellin [Bacteriovorax stolpii]AUN96600.1 flagellin FliC [Bacteriovorax stolpii]QDK43468.1 flagellin FliC [Bacteriovorax stolpii]TDP53879.1 flagellin [Bacteriovorax stolpii]BDT26621.1 flagellin FliC [Bacteriovorax sp. HI3]
MGLRIATNIASQNVQKNLKEVSNAGNSSLEKLSSGKRITKASDDAAGLAISTNLEAQTKGLRQATRNANDGISLVQTAEGGLNETTNILTRLRELTIQASSDTVGEQERGFLDKEYQQLTKEIDRISESTVFNGTQLLNGEGKGSMDFQVGAFAGEQNRITFDSGESDSSASAIGVKGTSISEKGDALSAIGDIDKAIEKVSGQRANLGSIQSRLQSTVKNLEVQTINQDSARSVIQDVDVAEATANLASNQVVKNAAVSTLAQANGIPNSALRLIG